jgi:hypothetical protein
LITPLEVCKVVMQSERIPRGGVTAKIHVLLEAVWKRGGIAGLYQGLGATMAKHSLHSCVYFATYAQIKSSTLAPDQHSSSGLRLGYNAASGFLVGMAAGVVNNPVDVLKSRLQVAAAADLKGHELARDYATKAGKKLFGEHNGTGTREGNHRVYGVLGPLMQLVRAEGPKVLWQGLGAKLLRLGPGSAIIFSVYEYSISWLQEKPIQ